MKRLKKIVKAALKKDLKNKEDLYYYILSKINNDKKTVELWATPNNGNFQNGGLFFINAKQNKKKKKGNFVKRFDYVYIYKEKVYYLDYTDYEIKKCKDKEILIYVEDGLYLPISKGKVVKNKKEFEFKKK